MAALTHCGKCWYPFVKEDISIIGNERPLVFAPCYHIFHQSCLSEWVTNAEKPCPLCHRAIYKHQAGKEFSVYQSVLFDALNEDPEIIQGVLQGSEHKNDCCSAGCFDDLPLIALRYDSDKNLLFHASCAHPETPLLTLQELASIVSEVIKKHPHLPPKFTPTPPTDFQRFRIDHPRLFTATLIAGAISMFITLRRN